MKPLAAALAGAVISAAMIYFGLLPSYRANYLAVGEANGSIAARWELANRLKNEFPWRSSDCSVKSTLFEVKATTVYVAECVGTKSVLVVE